MSEAIMQKIRSERFSACRFFMRSLGRERGLWSDEVQAAQDAKYQQLTQRWK